MKTNRDTGGERGNDRRVLTGRAAAPGVAVGRAVPFDPALPNLPDRRVPEDERQIEIERFKKALLTTAQEVRAFQANVSEQLGEEEGRIFGAHLAILEDQLLIEEVVRRIEEGMNAPVAFSEAMAGTIGRLSGAKNQYLQERTLDLLDIKRRVLAHLLGWGEGGLTGGIQDAILVAPELPPSVLLQLGNEGAAGFIIEGGGPSSHTVILGKALGIPGVVGVSDARVAIPSGAEVVLDGWKGQVVVAPRDEERERALARRAGPEALREGLEWARDLPNQTRDGYQFRILANVEVPSELELVQLAGMEGIGLFRTEFLFLQGGGFPDEEQQIRVYRQLFGVGNGWVTIRTFDLGADRFPVSVLRFPEPNPALGVRGIRLALRRPGLFRQQVRAILRAGAAGRVRILLPMVTTLEEFRLAKGHIEAEAMEVRRAGYPPPAMLHLGIMVETPAAALDALALAEEVDFFALGTNDLVQYTMAADRDNAAVSHLYQPYHPVLLRLVRQVIEAADRQGIEAIACGEMASEPWGASLLLGMGASCLSVDPHHLPRLKSFLTATESRTLKELAQAALARRDGQEVRDLLAESLPEPAERMEITSRIRS